MYLENMDNYIFMRLKNNSKICKKAEIALAKEDYSDIIICDEFEILFKNRNFTLWFGKGWIPPHELEGDVYSYFFGVNDILLVYIRVWNDYYDCSAGLSYSIHIPDEYEETFELWKEETNAPIKKEDMSIIIEKILDKIRNIKTEVFVRYRKLVENLKEYTDGACQSETDYNEIEKRYKELIKILEEIFSRYNNTG